MKTLINFLSLCLGVTIVLFATSCSQAPKGAMAIQSFDKTKYLGKWYEIARLDFKHERNLNNTTANYSLNEDGSIRVVNRGFNTVKNEWEEAIGKAKFRGSDKEAKLKVSFFGPFYSGYNVIAIDNDYQYALVAGKNLDYLWILSRTTTIPTSIKTDYLEKAKSLGYDVEKLVWVTHNNQSK
jgi:apolipoprotein D and lipocalin family protein